MPRVKTSVTTKARHKKTLKEAKGYFGSKHRLYKTAKEQVMHSNIYAYRDRRNKKRDFRKLWITRINAACRINNISYSKFINGLNKAEIVINRKMLSELAIDAPEAFSDLVSIAKDALNEKPINYGDEKLTKKEEVKPKEKETKIKPKIETKTDTTKKKTTTTKAKEVQKPTKTTK